MATKTPSPYQTVERIQRSLMQIQHQRTTETNWKKMILWSVQQDSGGANGLPHKILDKKLVKRPSFIPGCSLYPSFRVPSCSFNIDFGSLLFKDWAVVKNTFTTACHRDVDESQSHAIKLYSTQWQTKQASLDKQERSQPKIQFLEKNS